MRRGGRILPHDPDGFLRDFHRERYLIVQNEQLCFGSGQDTNSFNPNSHSQLAFALIAPIQITYAFTRSPFFNSFRSSSMSVFCTTIQCSSEPSLKRNSVVN